MLEKLINGTLQEEDYETLIENNTYDSKITEFNTKRTTETVETVINYSENNTYDRKITEFDSQRTTVTVETVINYSGRFFLIVWTDGGGVKENTYHSVCEVRGVEVLGIKWEPIENGRP